MPTLVRLNWRADTTPADLHPLLNALGEEYPIFKDATEGTPLCFEQVSTPGMVAARVTAAGEAVIGYSSSRQVARGIGTLLAGLADATPRHEALTFTTLGIMLDCSRNAVMTVACFKRWLRRLALFGYNTAMLYTEDTYVLPGEDCFGYMRGRYTADELRDIDAYAAALGIEMIPCIQTLGHLAQVLKWPAYNDVKDTPGVLMVDNEATYRLIEKMLDFWSSVFVGRRIHIGMDEAHDLGRGRYMDAHGHRRGFDLFNHHLARVTGLCAQRGLKPMIWSDMYFRMGSTTMDYYDMASRIPDDVKAAIPGDVDLVYWDYYHDDEAFYREWIRRHRDLGHSPIMASGVWTWSQLWCDHAKTLAMATPCIRACRAEGVKELLMTLWGDDGAYCEFESAMPTLAAIADLAYGHTDIAGGNHAVAKRFNAACDADFDSYFAASCAIGNQEGYVAGMLWDDPILGIFWRQMKGLDSHFERSWLEKISLLESQLAKVQEPGEGMEHAKALADVIKNKILLRAGLEEAYGRRDGHALDQLHSQIQQTIKAIEALAVSFRRQWLRRNKPFGLEVIQVRLAGLVARQRELALRLRELAAGKVESIPELDEPEACPGTVPSCAYRLVASSCPM
jgi:hypothetical protein